MIFFFGFDFTKMLNCVLLIQTVRIKNITKINCEFKLQ